MIRFYFDCSTSTFVSNIVFQIKFTQHIDYLNKTVTQQSPLDFQHSQHIPESIPYISEFLLNSRRTLRPTGPSANCSCPQTIAVDDTYTISCVTEEIGQFFAHSFMQSTRDGSEGYFHSFFSCPLQFGRRTAFRGRFFRVFFVSASESRQITE